MNKYKINCNNKNVYKIKTHNYTQFFLLQRNSTEKKNNVNQHKNINLQEIKA